MSGKFEVGDDIRCGSMEVCGMCVSWCSSRVFSNVVGRFGVAELRFDVRGQSFPQAAAQSPAKHQTEQIDRPEGTVTTSDHTNVRYHLDDGRMITWIWGIDDGERKRSFIGWNDRAIIQHPGRGTDSAPALV